MIITINVGIQKDRDGNDVEDIAKKLRRARQILAGTFGGYTETVTHGGWMREGELIEEEGRQYEIAVKGWADDIEVTQLAQWIGEVFNQTSVMVRVSDTMAAFHEVYYEHVAA